MGFGLIRKHLQSCHKSPAVTGLAEIYKILIEEFLTVKDTEKASAKRTAEMNQSTARGQSTYCCVVWITHCHKSPDSNLKKVHTELKGASTHRKQLIALSLTAGH